jgi:hypothetical protein
MFFNEIRKIINESNNKIELKITMNLEIGKKIIKECPKEQE